MCYQEDDIEKCLPAGIYKPFIQRQDLNKNYFDVLYRLERKVDGLHLKVDGVHQKVDYVKQIVEVSLEGIRDLQSKSDRAMAVMAYLATGETTPCPKLIRFVPQKRDVSPGVQGVKDRFKDVFYQKMHVYFLCENTYEKGHNDPMVMNFGRKWLIDLLPMIKLSLMTLRAAGVVESVVPFFPLPRLDMSAQQTHQDMEKWIQEMIDKGKSTMEGDRVARIKALVGSSYAMLSAKALKPDNMLKWENSMTPQTMFDDKGKKCKIKWVKVVV